MAPMDDVTTTRLMSLPGGTQISKISDSRDSPCVLVLRGGSQYSQGTIYGGPYVRLWIFEGEGDWSCSVDNAVHALKKRVYSIFLRRRGSVF